MAEAIYLDHNASTPCDPRVVEAMLPCFGELFANPSSRAHRPGQVAALRLEEARASIAHRLGARSTAEVVLTSGATEANVTALSGVTRALGDRRRHLVTQVTEHPSVLEPLARLGRDGFAVTLVGVDGDGRVRPDEVAASLRDDTVLVSVMLASNITGVVQPVAEIARLAHARGILVHCDAAQGGGVLEIDARALDVDLLTVSAHKIYGPKGIGALLVRRRRPPVALAPLLIGGGQEGGLRSGTVNLPGAVGLAAALELAAAERPSEAPRLAALRDRFETLVTSALDGVTVNGQGAPRLAGTTNLSFAGIDSSSLLASLPDVAVSSGSACTSTRPEPSPTLLAMGVSKPLARTAIRVGLGRSTTDAEVDYAAARIVEEVARLRTLAARRRR
jgi:cysteine desulfurase